MSGAALVAALLAAAPAGAAEPPARASDAAAILLGVLAVDAGPGLDPAGPLRATLALNPPGVEKVATLREWFPAAKVEAEAVAIDLAGRAPEGRTPPTAAQRGPTFLVDYDRPEAAPFREAVAALGPAPSDAALAALVNRWIEKKSMTRGIDSAGRVAARREGDCSEHAVLLAAAARLAGRPARVVFGVALGVVGGILRGFGHAWTELLDGGGRWSTVDATPLPEGVRYLPLAVVADEGPGYLGAAWGILTPLDVSRIAIVQGSRAAPGEERR